MEIHTHTHKHTLHMHRPGNYTFRNVTKTANKLDKILNLSRNQKTANRTQ